MTSILKMVETEIRARHPMRRYVALKKEVSRRVNRVRLRGQAVFCPCCEHSARTFLPNEICAFCESRPRQRFLWLYLKERIQPGEAIFHFAPEPCLQQLLRRRADIDYLSADITSVWAEVLVNLNAPDEFRAKLVGRAYSKIILSHVLEHVSDDAMALGLLKELLAKDGALLIQVPQDWRRAETYEDWSITSAAGRLRAFGQEDHVRIYGRDFTLRLTGAGFQVLSINPTDLYSAEVIARMSLQNDTIFVCTPRQSPGPPA